MESIYDTLQKKVDPLNKRDRYRYLLLATEKSEDIEPVNVTVENELKG